ncbi:CHRD domain-containing protein [Piscinibacter sakaiensis]|uniref:CHRD domain-containing protein n=1 Tax=Piscinibacter sakaiensis TaxID=1547922 RepID=UPI003AAD843E
MNLRSKWARLLASVAVIGLASCGGDGSPDTYTVSGTLAGSVGPVVVSLNGGNNVTLSSPGSFTFPTRLSTGSSYLVTADGAQNCNVTNAFGTVVLSNISNVTITCTTVVRSATLSGASENPPVTTTATGRGAIVVNPTTKEITGGATITGLTPSAGGHHIHQAPAGNPTGNGPVIIGLLLASDGRTLTVPANTVLTDAQYAALVAGELYMNIHTAAHPGGEIRGQLNQRANLSAGLATLTGAQEVPPVTTAASGRGTIVFDSNTRQVIIAYATHTVASPTVAHIHTGASGVSGPADVMTLNANTGRFTSPAAASLTAQNVTDFLAGRTYFNVHSTTFPAGEIRGQIAVQ